MSKLSRFFIGVIVVGLAFIASLHLYRAYENYVQQTEQDASGPTFTFNDVPVDFSPHPEAMETTLVGTGEKTGQEVFLGGVELDSETEKEQARQTIASILDDYRQDTKLQAFYADLQKATGEQISLADLSGENLGNLLEQYPQIQEVLARYAKDPEFTKTLQEIFSNPQFVRSVAILQLDAKEK